MRRVGFIALAALLFAAPALAQEEPPPPPVEPAAPAAQIVIGAHDVAGAPVTSATLTIDGQVVAYELDGKPLTLAPGPHTIMLQRNDGSHTRVTETVNVPEGVSVSTFTFPKSVPVVDPIAEPPRQPLVPRIVMAAGVVAMVTAAVIVLARPVIPGNCNADKGTCTRLSAESDADFNDDRSKAGRYRGFTTAGVVTLVAGAAVTAGGLAWYFLTKPKEPSTAIAPWVSPSAGGFVLRKAF